ncbi:MAG: hypothetical protein ABIL09_24760 [Gemmatimonadota bacterium]
MICSRARALLTAAAVVLAAATPARADTAWTALAGGEAWRGNGASGHGVLLLAADRADLPRQGRLGAEYNTDTFRLQAAGFRFRGGVLELGGQVALEGRYAGLLPDYYRQATRDEGRGFWASYAAAHGSAKLDLPGGHCPEVSVGVRRWAFSRNGQTSPLLVLPPDTWVLEARLRHTWWGLADDAAWRERHRLYPRLRGTAAGLELGLDRRGQHRPWGALDAEPLAPADRRNAPGATAVAAKPWLRWGGSLAPRLRLQAALQAAWGRGEDDLTRLRVGGMNPYVVPVAGMPWAAHLAGKMAGGSASLHGRVRGDTEAGLQADAAPGAGRRAHRRQRRGLAARPVGLRRRARRPDPGRPPDRLVPGVARARATAVEPVRGSRVPVAVRYPGAGPWPPRLSRLRRGGAEGPQALRPVRGRRRTSPRGSAPRGCRRGRGRRARPAARRPPRGR